MEAKEPRWKWCDCCDDLWRRVGIFIERKPNKTTQTIEPTMCPDCVKAVKVASS